MALASANEFPFLLLKEGTTPATPSAGDQRFFIDSADHKAKRVNSAGVVTTIEAGSVSLTNSTNQLSGDVTMTTANQFYDGPSLSLAAGTWLLIATVSFRANATNASDITMKLWDGTTVISSGEVSPAAAFRETLTLIGVASPGTTTTYKVSATGDQPSCIMKAAAIDNPAGNTASTLVAVKIG